MLANLSSGPPSTWLRSNLPVFTRTVSLPHTLCENLEFAIDDGRRRTQDAPMARESTPQDRLEALLDEVVGSGPMRLLLDEAIIRVLHSVEAEARERGARLPASTQVLSSQP
jgi:hypothetical protein